MWVATAGGHLAQNEGKKGARQKGRGAERKKTRPGAKVESGRPGEMGRPGEERDRIQKFLEEHFVKHQRKRGQLAKLLGS